MARARRGGGHTLVLLVLLVLLESRESGAVLELPVTEAWAWLDDTYDIVPTKAEGVVLGRGAFLRELLDG
ncbi:hypothetical protein [Streptomyces sp. E5N91]|uniref:hypothetical protein n=1 Tax=Streptomyces sp. E5N91 TaxID=1851996 RepID=UPI000EF59F4C|nr:hypothetical protein [Streptomyces sp. E5N91]